MILSTYNKNLTLIRFLANDFFFSICSFAFFFLDIKCQMFKIIISAPVYIC